MIEIELGGAIVRLGILGKVCFSFCDRKYTNLERFLTLLDGLIYLADLPITKY